MEMTYHCKVERKNRVDHIIKEIGIGQIVKEKYIRSQDNIARGQMGSYKCITDTGVTIIKNETKTVIITMYVTTYRELVSVYGGPKGIPNYLRKKVDRNQTYFTKDGKTIWK